MKSAKYRELRTVATDDDRKDRECAADTACPKCGARVVFRRVSSPSLDSSGLVGYVIQCNECSTWLTGMIDPDDGVLVLL
jgi:DNA-directed RNA polymerase subunit RPC12/RpoP